MVDAFEKYRDARNALDSNDLDRAERLLLESLELSPHFKTHELLGDILLQRGDDEDALLHFAAAHNLNPKSDSAATRYAQVLLAAGRANEARAIIDAVLQRNPSYGPARQLGSLE